jgi:hypothetical protein
MTLPTDPKARKAIPIYSGFVKYFPDAMVAVAELSRIGNDQHSPGKPLHWDRSKSGDEMDALMRHLLDDAAGVPVDTDGVAHLAKVAWRAMAALQKACEKDAWLTWNGGPMPVAEDQKVIVRIADGRVSDATPAGHWLWSRGVTRIVAYKMVEE